MNPPNYWKTPPLTDDIISAAQTLCAQMTIDEKIDCLSGDGPTLAGTLKMISGRYNEHAYVAGAVPRLNIDGIRFTDGPRGIVMGASTCFPVSMARGASFDPVLEERIGDAIGVEARSQGANLFAGVCINLLRNPRWGRAQETYGEDSHLLGEMGAALVRGSQRHVMACVKHYAVNSMENSRFWVNINIAEADLRDIYLPHFKRCVDAGAAAIMSAYNQVNGEWCGGHTPLLTHILKKEWGFSGFVMSDFILGVRNPGAQALAAGLDLEMPHEWNFKQLRRLAKKNKLDMARIDDAVTRLLQQQLRFKNIGEPARYSAAAVASPAHRALAREAACSAMVLLRNEALTDNTPVLPLNPNKLHSIAVIGKLANHAVVGDLGSSRVYAPDVVTILQGLSAAGLRHHIHVAADDGRDLGCATALASSSSVAIVVVGNTFKDEGEWIGKAGGDRQHLRLRNADVTLIRSVAAVNPHTLVVLLGSSTFVIQEWQHEVAAIVMAWYPGMEGGHAVADVLFGEQAPGGRLPCTWPQAEAHLPPFKRFARHVNYGPLHGYRLAEARAFTPAFAFGFGLGYTQMDILPPRFITIETVAEQRYAHVEMEVINRGCYQGVEVIQAYIAESLGSELRALRTLRDFCKLKLNPGERSTAHLRIPLRNDTSTVWVGTSSRLIDLYELSLQTTQAIASHPERAYVSGH